ncbi:MAG: glycosyltransferase family 39 protein [Pseudanabaenaceae cyanobacterium bins.68]|nr:glycosyltransferase family 39 protein [Pseudanabaenaceae cyanobacterium bins.68]
MGDRRFFRGFLVAVIVLGIGLRWFELDRKLLWHDEVYTQFRAAGFSRKQIDQQLFQNRLVLPQELQSFLQLKPNSTEQDTIASLIQEDPQHPPLYFLMARSWLEWFGGSIAVARLLPALLSLLTLPLMFGWAWELFAEELEVDLIGLLAMALVAISPFDLLFAQTARQYSLLTAAVVGSSYLLIRSLRWGIWQNWLLYLSSITLGFYTHPFFGLTLAAQIVFVVWRSPRTGLKGVGSAIAAALVLYSPWILVLAVKSQQALATTDWARVPVGIDYLAKLWLLSFTAIFFDLDFGFHNPWTFLVRLPYLLLILVSFYALIRRSPRSSWQFLLVSWLVPFGLLALPDLLLGGKRSAVSRYLISTLPAIQLAIAYFLITWQPNLVALAQPRLAGWQRLWLNAWRLKPWILSVIITGAVVSCGASALANTWWSKDLSYHNGLTAQNIPPGAVVISDRGPDFTNTGDLISLSFLVPPNTQFYLTKDPADFEAIATLEPRQFYLFRPTTQLKQAFEQRFGELERVILEERLWRARLKLGNA